jgi:integrase
MKITEQSVKALAPAATDAVHWDDDLPGFGVRVKPSGQRSFVIQYRAGNISRRLTIGGCSLFRVEEARKRARKLLVEVKDGADPASDRKDTRKAPTVGELADRYMAVHAATKKKPRSAKSDESNLRLHVLPALARQRAADVTREDVSRLHHAMRETPGAANRVLALLSKMFNLAEKWGIRADGSNPCRHVDRYAERKMERFLSGDELARLGAALADAERTATEAPEVIAAIRLLICTGARLSEILELRWEHVDFERACLRLPDSKTGRKVIHLNAPALEVLSGLGQREASPWVIPGAVAGNPLVNLRKPWHRIRAKAGLDGVRLHDLRHSFASVGVAGGLSLPMIGALLGHTQPVTTQRYAHLAADPLKQANDLIGSRIAAAMKGSSGAEVVTLPKRSA